MREWSRECGIGMDCPEVVQYMYSPRKWNEGTCSYTHMDFFGGKGEGIVRGT